MGSFGCCFCYGVGGIMQKFLERFTTAKIKPFDASADVFALFMPECIGQTTSG